MVGAAYGYSGDSECLQERGYPAPGHGGGPRFINDNNKTEMTVFKDTVRVSKSLLESAVRTEEDLIREGALRIMEAIPVDILKGLFRHIKIDPDSAEFKEKLKNATVEQRLMANILQENKEIEFTVMLTIFDTEDV